MKWFRSGPRDLSLSNEYQQLMTGGCINCHALVGVLKSENITNFSVLRGILSKVPANSSYSGEGCWAYLDRLDYYPTCLGGLKDDDPNVIQARDEIIRARRAIKDSAQQAAKERAHRFREVRKRRLP